MRKVEVTIYKYSELSEDAREGVRVNREANDLEYPLRVIYSQALKDKFKETIFKGLEVTNIYWSNSSSQGDGLCFEYSGIDAEYLKEVIDHLVSTKEITPLDAELLKSDNVYIRGYANHQGRYYHERSCIHTFSVENNAQDGTLSDTWLDAMHEVLSGEIIDRYYAMCEQAFKEVQKHDDDFYSDEEVNARIEAEDLEYFENGDVYNSF